MQCQEPNPSPGLEPTCDVTEIRSARMRNPNDTEVDGSKRPGPSCAPDSPARMYYKATWDRKRRSTRPPVLLFFETQARRRRMTRTSNLHQGLRRHLHHLHYLHFVHHLHHLRHLHHLHNREALEVIPLETKGGDTGRKCAAGTARKAL